MDRQTQEQERTSPNTAQKITIGVLLAIILGLPALVALDNPAFLLLPFVFFAWVAVPAYIGSRLGRVRVVGARAGSLLGLLLGFFGVLIVYLFPASGERVKCPHCDERILATARICKHCHQPVEPVALEPEFDD